MDVTGIVKKIQYDADFNLLVTLQINEKSFFLEGMNKLKDKLLNIKIVLYRKKKSDEARRYFWKLVQMLSPYYRLSQWETYITELRKYGVAEQVNLPKKAFETLKRQFRAYEIEEEWVERVPDEDGVIVEQEMMSVIFYIGMSEYDTLEMSRLIEGTVDDCKEWGLETLPPDQLKEMELAWKGGSHG